MTQTPKVSNKQLLRATPARLRVDFAIALLCIFTDFLGDNLLAPSYELFIREHGVPGMGFGLSTSIITMSFILGRCFASSVMGPISDHTGRWNTIMVCTFLMSVGFLLQALSWNFWSLVGFRLFTGFVGGTRVVIIVYITDWISERNMLTFWMSFIPIVSSVSSFVGPFLGGIVAEADPSQPLNPAYAGLALNACSFLLVLFFMRRSPHDGGFRLFKKNVGNKKSSSAAKPLNSVGPLVEWNAVLLWFIVCGISSAGTQGWSVLIVTIQKELGLSSLVIGSISGWCGIMIIIGQLVVLPILFHRLKLSEGAVVVFGFSLSLFIIILGFVSNVWVTIIIGSFFSLGIPLVMTMGFSIFSRLCDPSKKSLVVGLMALDLNAFKILSILLSGLLYDMSKWTPYFFLFCLVTIGLVTGFILIRVMPSALRRRSKVKVLLAATEISRSRCDINFEKRRSLHTRLAFANEETQGNVLALPYGRATEDELESVMAWLKACVFLPPRTVSHSKGDLVPDLLKSLLGRWTTRMLEHHGYVNWYECDGEIEMLLNAGFPPLRLEPEHQRLMRLQDHYYSLERHLAACRAFSSKNPAVDVSERLMRAVSKLRSPPHQKPTLAMRINFGRWLARFLNERGYQSWPSWFSDGRVIPTLLRSTFPPIKSKKDSALRSLAVLSPPLKASLDSQSTTASGGLRSRKRVP